MFRRGDYEALPGINWSLLKSMRVSAKQYKHDAEQRREDTEALRIGIAVHAFVLEPEKFKERFITYRLDKSKGEGARKAWLAFQEEHKDKVILSPNEYDRAIGAGMAVLDCPTAAQHFCGGVTEMAWQWTDPETGLLCKGRADQWLSRVVELKTSRHALPHLFRVDAARLGYVTQLAWYRDGLRAHGVDVADDAIMVTVQNVPPHDCVTYRVSAELLQVGRDQYRELLIKLKRCMDTGFWPGVATDALDLEMPEWWFPKDDLELTMGGLPLEVL